MGRGTEQRLRGFFKLHSQGTNQGTFRIEYNALLSLDACTIRIKRAYSEPTNEKCCKCVLQQKAEQLCSMDNGLTYNLVELERVQEIHFSFFCRELHTKNK